MSLTQSDHRAQSGPAAAPYDPGRGMRPEDILRLITACLLVLAVGLALGGFTFHELAFRGTAYYVVAVCIAIALTALTYYRFQPALVVAVGVLWIRFGSTPNLAEGVTSGVGRSLYPVEIALLFLLAIWAIRGIMLGQLRIISTPMNISLVAFLAFNVWSAINGWMFWDPAVAHFYAGDPSGGRTPPQVIEIEMALRFFSVGVFWLVASSLTDAKCLRWASLALLLPGIDTFLAHIVPDFPESGSLYDALLEIILACTLFAWLLENPGAKKGLRFWGWLALALIFFQTFILSISWVSGWYGMAAGLLSVAWLKSKKLCVGMIAVGAALVIAIRPFLERAVVSQVATSGDLDRFSMIRAAFLYALHYPLGVGPGNYRAYNIFYGSRAMWNTTGYTSAHDFYAQMLSELGFGGLTLTAIFVLTGIVMLTRFYRACPPGFSRTVILGIAGMWVGLCASTGVGDYLIPVYYNGGLVSLATTIYAWIGLGIAVCHARQMGVLSPSIGPLKSPPKAVLSQAASISGWPTRRGAPRS